MHAGMDNFDSQIELFGSLLAATRKPILQSHFVPYFVKVYRLVSNSEASSYSAGCLLLILVGSVSSCSYWYICKEKESFESRLKIVLVCPHLHATIEYRCECAIYSNST